MTNKSLPVNVIDSFRSGKIIHLRNGQSLVNGAKGKYLIEWRSVLEKDLQEGKKYINMWDILTPNSAGEYEYAVSFAEIVSQTH